MSILIKGMEIPKSCYFCPMTNDGFYLCKANNPYRQLEDDCEERRPSWCPLVPVPEHGRLIDADSLKETFCGNCFADEKPMECSEPCMDMRIILDAPTIIPAEEGET